MLKMLIHKTENNKRYIKELEKMMEADYELRKELFEDQSTRPSYMNYVLAQETMKESKASAVQMFNLIYDMQRLLESEVDNYKEKRKLIEYEFGSDK